MDYKILVVDDETEVVEIVGKKLQESGYRVTSAYSGEEALLKVKDEKPDIILLDLILPGINGYDVLKQIRQTYKERWIPIIIISARTELDSIRDCYGMEADHYLTKPCEMENILRGIRTMISLMPYRIVEKKEIA